MYYYTGSYPKNGRRPYIRALNVHIYRYFFSIAAMSEYLGVSRQALKKRIDKMLIFGFPAFIKKNRRFEGRRVVRRKIIYYEWQTLYYLACYYKTPEALYVRELFYPPKIMANFDVCINEGIFVSSIFVN